MFLANLTTCVQRIPSSPLADSYLLLSFQLTRTLALPLQLCSVHSYLTKRQQQLKIDGSFSILKCSFLGVPQGSVLGHLLFNIYINYFFYLVKNTEVCNYADDTNIFVCGRELDPILKSLEKDASLLSSWFANNCMKMNGDRSYLLMLGNISVEATVNISGYLVL